MRSEWLPSTRGPSRSSGLRWAGELGAPDGTSCRRANRGPLGRDLWWVGELGVHSLRQLGLCLAGPQSSHHRHPLEATANLTLTLTSAAEGRRPLRARISLTNHQVSWPKTAGLRPSLRQALAGGRGRLGPARIRYLR